MSDQELAAKKQKVFRMVTQFAESFGLTFIDASNEFVEISKQLTVRIKGNGPVLQKGARKAMIADDDNSTIAAIPEKRTNVYWKVSQYAERFEFNFKGAVKDIDGILRTH